MATRRKIFQGYDGRELHRRKTGIPSWRGDPGNDLVRQAGKFRAENKHDEAIDCYQKVLMESGEVGGLVQHACLRRAIVECLCAKGEYSQARKEIDELKFFLATEVKSISKELESIRLLSAMINIQIGSYEEAEIECKEALQGLEGGNRDGRMGELLMTLGSISLHQGDMTSARRYYEDCLNHLGEKERSLELAKVFNYLAQLHFVKSEWRDALDLLKKSLGISESLGEKRMTASMIGNLGTVNLLMGKWEKAEDNLLRSLGLWNDLGDQLAIVRKYVSLGSLFMMRREWGRAEEYYTQARDISREKGYMRELCLALEFSGELAYDREKFGLASRYYSRALALAQNIAPDGDMMGELHRRLAELLISTGDLNGAMESCEKSLSYSLRLGDRYEEAIVYRVFGRVFEAMGQTDRARNYFSQGIDGLTSIGEQYERGKTLLDAAVFLKTRYSTAGDKMQAERHCRKAAAIFNSLGVDYYFQKANKEWEELKTNL